MLTTWPADGDATAAARTLVDERLAACVSVLEPMTSVYRWDGRVTEDRERQLVIKTTAARGAAVEARLRELHPYDVPELLVLPIAGGGGEYLRWVQEQVTGI
ncbi:MAG: divalent-cation tolerance protein CutA [Vicinamibacterales bacterium]